MFDTYWKGFANSVEADGIEANGTPLERDGLHRERYQRESYMSSREVNHASKHEVGGWQLPLPSVNLMPT